MSNNTRPRKVNESSHLSSSSTVRKAATKMKVNTAFEAILATFLDIGLSDLEENRHERDPISPNAVKMGVKQLLASLKIVLVRLQADPTREMLDDFKFEAISKSTMEALNQMNNLITFGDICFPETMTLAGLTMAFLLLVYFTHCETRFTDSHNQREALLATGDVFFLMFESERLSLHVLQTQFDRPSFDDIIAKIERKIKPFMGDSFRFVALFHGFLYCSPLVQLIITYKFDSFVNLFRNINRLAKDKATESYYFHVVRLQHQFFKILLDYDYTLLRYDESEQAHTMIHMALAVLDVNWESPISGVNSYTRDTYHQVIQLTRLLSTTCDIGFRHRFQQILETQFAVTLSLPFTAKAKYRKLATLYRCLKAEDQKVDVRLVGANELVKRPFLEHKNFAYEVFEHLSINSLATPVADFYKSYLDHILEAYGPVKGAIIWRELWLEPFVSMFRSHETSLASSTVVQNALLAHIFPHLLARLPEVFSQLYEGLADNLYGKVALVRVCLQRGPVEGETKKMSVNLAKLVVDPQTWLEVALRDSDDAARAEALMILLEERLVQADRNRLYDLVLKFIAENMNVDDAPFRQKVLCRLEQFYAHIFESLEYRIEQEFGLKVEINSKLKETSMMIKFLFNTFELAAGGIVPGSSFQRKFTALNIISFLLAAFKRIEVKFEVCKLRPLETIIGKTFESFGLGKKKGLPIGDLLLMGLVDKDDKIRRLSSEMIIKYEQWSYVRAIGEKDSDYLREAIDLFLCSPRHQETHIGGLLIKYLFRTKFTRKINGKSVNILLYLTQAPGEFFDLKNLDLVHQARHNPLHGWALAMNQCLTFDSIYEGFNMEPTISKERLVMVSSQLRIVFIKSLKFDALVKYFLNLLTPSGVQHSGQLLAQEEEEEENLATVSSPSFYEMCQSIQAVLDGQTEKMTRPEGVDVFQSNDFQLILSMAWMNIKEGCFLMANMVSLYADLLTFFCSLTDRSEDLCLVPLLTAEEFYQAGLLLMSVMLRCRHKGVIEACGVAFTRVIRFSMSIIHSLDSPEGRQLYGATLAKAYRQKFAALVDTIFEALDGQTGKCGASNITRRSAGLAYVVQAALVGEAEATITDGGAACINGNIYQQAVMILMENASVPVELPEEAVETPQEDIDLPQANALHVLQTIVGTSALAPLTIKTVGLLMPLCIAGFRSPHWQIRNASLTLFGACTTRMLGQPKKTKTSKESGDLGSDFNATITFKEFVERYPDLVEKIFKYLYKRPTTETQQSEFYPDVVPVLALLASFTPGDGGSKHKEIRSMLEPFLGDRIWKIRMLAARAMANTMTIDALELFVRDKIQSANSCNSFHGLLCCVEVLFELKAATIFQDRHTRMKQFRDEMRELFQPWLVTNCCSILDDFAANIFEGQRGPAQLNLEGKTTTSVEELRFNEHNPLLENLKEPVKVIPIINESILNIDENSDNELKRIQTNVTFRKPEEIRMATAEHVYVLIGEFVAQADRRMHLMALLYLVDILQTILEDEERDIRLVGQKAVYLLAMATGVYVQASDVNLAQQAFSPTVSIEALYQWATATAKKNGHRLELLSFLLAKLLTRFDSAEIEEILAVEGSDEKKEVLLLFEKEEKNVFAEPYRMARAIEKALEDLDAGNIKHPFIEEKLSPIFDRWESFQKADAIRIENILRLSVWRLPKLFANLVIVQIFARFLRRPLKLGLPGF